MNTKEFHVGDILSITTGRLVSLKGMDGVYEILNYMTGEILHTVGIPRAADDALPYLIQQLPWLVEVNKLFEELEKQEDFDWHEVMTIVEELGKRYGITHQIYPIPQEDRERLTLEEELARIRGPQNPIEVLYWIDGKLVTNPKNN